MSKPMWGGNAQPVEKAGRKNHTPVLAPPEKIDMGMMPSFGPIAVAPLDTNIAISGVDYILSDLCEIKNIQLQKGKDEINSDTRGLVWMDSSASQIHLLEEILTEYKQLGWIQLPMAGINSYSSLIERFSDRLWTSAKGAYAQPVAEHALTLALALLRYLPMRVRASSWGDSQGLSLFNSNVVILGAGGITLCLLALLEPFRPNVTILRRKAEPLDDKLIPPNLKGRVHFSTLAELDKHLSSVDVIFAACALTPDTRNCLRRAQFNKMHKDSIVVNVARGEVIDTDDLIIALRSGQIGGAGLDVTAPEPLPDGHPLWDLASQHRSMDTDKEKGGKQANIIIVSRGKGWEKEWLLTLDPQTPHTADTLKQVVPLLSQRAYHNVEALQSGSGLFEGLVDTKAGY